MPVKYNQDMKARAIRLVREHGGDYPSEYAAITAVAGRLGMAAETLRKWIRRAEVDEGRAAGVPAASPRRSASCGGRTASWSRPWTSCAPRRLSSRGSTTRCTADLRVHRCPPGPLRGRADLPRAVRAWRADRPEDVLGAPVPAAVEAAGARRCPDRDPGADA